MFHSSFDHCDTCMSAINSSGRITSFSLSQHQNNQYEKSVSGGHTIVACTAVIAAIAATGTGKKD